MRVTYAIAVASISLSPLSFGQGAFPLKPGQEPVAPLENPTGKDEPATAVVPKPATAVVPKPATAVVPSVAVKAEPPVAVEPKSRTDSEVPEAVIASGDSLTKVSATVYGRPGYWRVLKLYNDCDPGKLKVGQIIKTPDLGWLLERENIVPLLKDAADAMMQGRKLFMEVEDSMSASGSSTITDEMKAKIAEAQKFLANSRELFSNKREGVPGLPNSTLLQLRTAGELMGKVAAGTSVSTNMAQVHERFGNAITYCVLWARDGFK